jgi:hypothetical protein
MEQPLTTYCRRKMNIHSILEYGVPASVQDCTAARLHGASPRSPPAPTAASVEHVRAGSSRTSRPVAGWALCTSDGCGSASVRFRRVGCCLSTRTLAARSRRLGKKKGTDGGACFRASVKSRRFACSNLMICTRNALVNQSQFTVEHNSTRELHAARARSRSTPPAAALVRAVPRTEVATTVHRASDGLDASTATRDEPVLVHARASQPPVRKATKSSYHESDRPGRPWRK